MVFFSLYAYQECELSEVGTEERFLLYKCPRLIFFSFYTRIEYFKFPMEMILFFFSTGWQLPWKWDGSIEELVYVSPWYTIQVMVSILKLHSSLYMKLINQSLTICVWWLIICENTLHSYYLFRINIASYGQLCLAGPDSHDKNNLNK